MIGVIFRLTGVCSLHLSHTRIAEVTVRRQLAEQVSQRHRTDIADVTVPNLKFIAKIVSHFHLHPQFTYELFHVL